MASIKELIAVFLTVALMLDCRSAAAAAPPATSEAEMIKQFQAQIAAAEAKVTGKEQYEPAARALALLCQSDRFCFLDESPLRPAWTPPEVLKLNPTWVHIEAEEARVEFGGGFHHFGYRLALNKDAGNDKQNNWTLNFDSEGAKPRALLTFMLDKSQHVERREFVARGLAEFERRAKETPVQDERVRDRLVFLLKFDEVELARKSIRDCAAGSADDWPDQLLAYLISPKSDANASASLDAWAKMKADSCAWLFAAYAYGLAGDADALERSVKAALKFPMDDPDWAMFNARFRGTTVCFQLLKARRYATCGALCDALLAYAGGDNMVADITAVRDLARQGKDADPPPLSEDGSLLDPFKGIDLARLRETKGATTGASAPATTQAAEQTPNGDRLLKYYDQRIAADPKSKDAHTVKITYLLSQQKTEEALEACRTAAKAFPDWWRPPVGLAMLGDRESRKANEAQLVKWVKDHPAFLHSWYFAAHYYRGRDNQAAIVALKVAVKSPLENVDDDAGWVPSAFAFEASKFAYQHGEYELVLEIARVWASPRGVYNYFDDNIYAFRAAAELALGKFAEAKADADKAVKARETHANWAGNLAELQKAAHAEDQKYSYDPGYVPGRWEVFPARE